LIKIIGDARDEAALALPAIAGEPSTTEQSARQKCFMDPDLGAQ
jgi:hypothetical protein